MNINKSLVAGLALCCLAAPASAACPSGGHQVTNLYSAGGGACFWFEVDSGPWYTVPLADSDYQIEWNIVQEAHTTQTCNFSYTQSSTNACGQPRAVGIGINGP